MDECNLKKRDVIHKRNHNFLHRLSHGIVVLITVYPTNIYLLKVNNRNTRKMCEIYSKLKIKSPERRH